MDLVTVILTVFLGGIILVLASFLSLRRGRRASCAPPPEEEQSESSQQTMGSDSPVPEQANRESGMRTTLEASTHASAVNVLPDEPLVPGRKGSDKILSQRVYDHKNHLVLLRTYVSRQAYFKGRALLETLGLTRAQIAKYYGMYPQMEEESVQDGLQAWIDGDINATWRDLLEAMKMAGIAVQQRDGLKKELYSSAGGTDMVKDEEKARASATAGSDATVGYPPIIPDIKANYVDVKDVFVDVCTTQGTPTLDQVKDRCIDLIECVFRNMPQISCYKNDIDKAETLPKLARVVCFQLSSWISYDFFKKVIVRFQPALRIVNERLIHYEDQLKLLLQQKLEYIAELQQQEDSYEVPENMAEFAVKYGLEADGLQVKDLIAHKDFLAQRLGIPSHLLQFPFWRKGSVVITYRTMRDVLPIAELALYREDARAELTQHGVEDVYFASHPSEQPRLVDQPPQTVHLQRRAIVTVLDAHCKDLDATSLTSDLKGMGLLTEEQYQKLASLDDERRHEALLYTLLAHDGPDTYDKLVECVGLRDTSIAADLETTFEDVKKSPGVLSVISSSQAVSPSAPVPAHDAAALPMASDAPSKEIPQPVTPTRDWRKLGECRKVIQHSPRGGGYIGIAVNSEDILAVTDDRNGSVHLLSKDGTLVRSIGGGVLSNNLWGVAFDLRGNVWVADQGNHNVVNLSQEDSLLQTIHHAGSDQLSWPSGVSVSQRGLIYICDSDNHYVTVCDEEGKFLSTFGSKGSGPGCFDAPHDITFGSDGLMYVTDKGNRRVCVWSSEGTFMRDFKTEYIPTCIAATSDDHLVITSYGPGIIMVYTLEGELVHEFGGYGSDLGRFSGPWEICVDDDGLVYVVDRENYRIQVF